MRVNIAALMILIAATQPTAAEEYADGDWSGRSMVNAATGNFEGCLVKRENGAGEKLSFVMYFDTGDAFGKFSLVATLSSPALQLIKDKLYPGEILVDGIEIELEKDATAVTTYAVVFILPFKNKILDTLGEGGMMVAAVSGERISFSLNGGARALEWLRACTQRGVDAFARSHMPKAGESKDISREAMAMTLDRAGLAGYVLDPPDRRGGEEINHEWKWRGVYGMQFYGAKSGEELSDVIVDLIGGFRVDCPGSPEPSVEISRFPIGLAYGRASFDCDDGSQKLRYAIIAADDLDRVMFFVHSGLVDFAADISVADEGVFAALTGMFR